MVKKYECKICKYICDQKSHIESHIETEKHNDKKEVLKLRLEKISKKELLEKFEDDNIDNIIKKYENFKITENKDNKIIENKDNKIIENKIIENKDKNFKKKKKTNKVILNESPTRNNKDKEFKDIFINFINKMHNLLRGVAITGDDAHDDIMHTLMLCCLEDKINLGEIDLLDVKYYENDIGEDFFNNYYKDKVIKISDLIKDVGSLRKSEGLSSIEMCGQILNLHPKTKGLIKERNFIKCNDRNIIYNLFKETIEFNKVNNIFEKFDIIGLAYEYFSTKHGGNGGTSKEMGQYFTERPLMFRCFELILEEDIKDLGIDNNSTIGDEFCATFGFPLALKSFLDDRFKINIRDKNIYGVEYHDRLSRFAKMNAIFSLKNSDNVIKGDSFISNVSPHLDISVHNVPFGQSMTPKNIKDNYIAYHEVNKNTPDIKEYLPFCDKKIDAILASQVVLYKTKKMGLLIIKDGKETSAKNNGKYRKWFCENCIVKRIMKIPSGAFTCTGTKTVCIYFIKKQNKKTENIQFLELSEDGNKIIEMCNVSYKDLKDNNFSWDPNVYIIDEEQEKRFKESKCEFKKLGDLIDINIGSTPSTKNNKYWEDGKHIWITISELKDDLIPVKNSKKKLTDLALKECKLKIVKKGTILMSFKLSIGKFGIAGCDLYTNEAILHLGNIKNITDKYIMYYLKYNKPISSHGCIGGGSLNQDDLFNLIIPIPNINIQEETVKILDDLTEQKQILINRKEGIFRQMKYYFDCKLQTHREEVEFKKLGDICEIFSGIYITKDMKIEGKYPVYGGGNPSFYINCSNYENEIIISKDGVSEKCVRYEKNKFFLNHHGWVIKNKENIIKDYLYYLLIFNEKRIYSLAKGGGQKGINQENFKNLEVSFNSISNQKEIIDYLNKLEDEKNNIDNEIKEIDNLIYILLKNSYN